MNVDEIRPGMKGEAHTVFHGQTPDKFEIEVVDVVRNYLPKQDAILFRSDDPRLVHTGIVGGMSGSPIFIDGKLVGALAYGYRFNKDPVGGITPISNMLAVGELPYRPEALPQHRGRSRRGSAAWADAMLGLDTSPLPTRRRPDELEMSGGLIPLSVPLSVSGLGPSATRALGESLGLVPVRGGSGGSTPGPASKKQTSWKPGDAVSVILVQGESSVAPAGTITHVGAKGDKLLGFGHPMFGDGPTNLPFATSRVHTIISSIERPVKVSSPLDIAGTMIQDRQAAISLRTNLQAPLIPVTTTFAGAESALANRSYRNEVAVGIDLTPSLAASLLIDAIEEAGRDATEVVLELEQEYDVETSKGPRTVAVREESFFPNGISARLVGRSRGVLVLAAMLDNEFEVAQIRGIRQNAKVSYGAPVEEIVDVRVPNQEVRAGDIVRLQVRLRGYRGDVRTEV